MIYTNRKAFTLAEVLISIVIIGIIAALTIPTLMSHWEKQQYVTNCLKAYSALQATSKRILIDAGVSSFEELGLTDNTSGDRSAITDLFVSHMKIIKRGTSGSTDIFTLSGAYNFDGTNQTFLSSSPGTNAFITNDGIAYLIQNMNTAIAVYGLTDSVRTSNQRVIFVDINNTKGPNRFGRDRFEFNLRGDGVIIPAGSPLTYPYAWDVNSTGHTCRPNPDGTSMGYSSEVCSARIIQEHAMDY